MIAFICCSATSGFVLNVSMPSRVPQIAFHRPRCAMIYFVRWGTIVALVAVAAPASAEPLEWSAFFGADKLPKTIALGGAAEPEQRPFTGPIVGGHRSRSRSTSGSG